MTNPIDTQILDLNRPGVVVEVDVRTAEAPGRLRGGRPRRGGGPGVRRHRRAGGPLMARTRGEGPVLRAGCQQAHRAASGRDRPLAEALGAGEHPPAPQPGLRDPVQGLELHVAGDAGQGRPALDDLQAGQQRGRQVRRGEKGTLVQYWKLTDQIPVKDERGKPVLDGEGNKVYRNVQLEKPKVFSAVVFNAEQIDGLPPLQIRTPDWDRHERAESVLQASGVRDPPRPAGPRLLPACHGPDSPADARQLQECPTPITAPRFMSLGTHQGIPPAWTGTWPTPSAASATPRRSYAPRSRP
jgi:hypothetical protein